MRTEKADVPARRRAVREVDASIMVAVGDGSRSESGSERVRLDFSSGRRRRAAESKVLSLGHVISKSSPEMRSVAEPRPPNILAACWLASSSPSFISFFITDGDHGPRRCAK